MLSSSRLATSQNRCNKPHSIPPSRECERVEIFDFRFAISPSPGSTCAATVLRTRVVFGALAEHIPCPSSDVHPPSYRLRYQSPLRPVGVEHKTWCHGVINFGAKLETRCHGVIDFRGKLGKPVSRCHWGGGDGKDPEIGPRTDTVTQINVCRPFARVTCDSSEDLCHFERRVSANRASPGCPGWSKMNS
jgi:hypothetical protein